jgi:hypothetical protein
MEIISVFKGSTARLRMVSSGCSDRLRTQQLHLLRFRLVRKSFRGSNLRCRDSRQPTSSSILSSCDTSSLLGFLLHCLSLLQHYSQWTSESRIAKLLVHLSPDLLVPELHFYSHGVHSTSSAQTVSSDRHPFYWLECLLQRADWSAVTLAYHCCDLFRVVGFRDCGPFSDWDWDYRDSAVVSCLDRSSHSWYSSGLGERDCSYRCYIFISPCSCSIDPDCFIATCFYRGSAW